MNADIRDAEVSAFADPAADLDDAEPEGVELEASGLGGEEPASELVEQPVGGGVQEEAEGVGPEAVIAEAIGGQGVLEILDPVLRLAPVDVAVIDDERVVGPGGHDEAGVGPLQEDLGLEDDPARVGPGV